MSSELRKWARFVFAAMFAFAFFAIYEKASAATLTCAAAAAIVDSGDAQYTGGFDVTGSVTPTDACAVGTANNDQLNLALPNPPLRVNADAVFGISNWVFAEKLQTPDGGTLLTDNSVEAIDIGLSTSTGSTTGGTWSINNVWSLYDEIMLVFKSGNGSSTNPNNYVAYLLTEGAVGGSYTSPFHHTNQSLVSISHISAYVVPTVVPLPAALPLFAGALMGMGILGNRRARRRRATCS